MINTIIDTVENFSPDWFIYYIYTSQYILYRKSQQKHIHSSISTSQKWYILNLVDNCPLLILSVLGVSYFCSAVWNISTCLHKLTWYSEWDFVFYIISSIVQALSILLIPVIHDWLLQYLLLLPKSCWLLLLLYCLWAQCITVRSEQRYHFVFQLSCSLPGNLSDLIGFGYYLGLQLSESKKQITSDWICIGVDRD